MNSRATVSGVQNDAPVAIGGLEARNPLVGDLEALDPADPTEQSVRYNGWPLEGDLATVVRPPH